MKTVVDVVYDAEAKVLKLNAPLEDVPDKVTLRVVIEHPAREPSPDNAARRAELIGLFGILSSDPIERPPQGELEEREPVL